MKAMIISALAAFGIAGFFSAVPSDPKDAKDGCCSKPAEDHCGKKPDSCCEKSQAPGSKVEGSKAESKHEHNHQQKMCGHTAGEGAGCMK